MIVVFIIYLLFLVGVLSTLNYEKEFKRSLNKKEHSLFFLYSFSLFISHFFENKKSERYRKRIEQIRLLHANEDIAQQYKIFLAKKISVVLFCLLIFNTLGAFIIVTNRPEKKIQNGAITRPSYGEDAEEVDVNVVIDKDGEQVEQQLKVSVDARAYTQEEFTKAATEAEEYLDQRILGKNISLLKIYYPLNLVKSIPDTGLTVSWTLDDSDILLSDGTIDRTNVTEDTSITITATIKNEEFEQLHTISLVILPEHLSEEDELLYNLSELVEQANEDTDTEDQMVLPDFVEDYEISYEEPSKSNYASLAGFALLILVLIYFAMEQQLVKQKEERDMEIMIDYPELINKFTLLIGAGMTVKRAWEKIVCEYEEHKQTKVGKRRYAYEELKVTLFELNNGENESRAYERFGRRMQATPYMKFGALLAQNSSKGTEGILSLFELEAVNAFEDRKELAKRLGEKAGTKLLLPMGIMLCLVFLMILIPAFLSF